MPRKKKPDSIAMAVGQSYEREPKALDHQPSYGSQPWKEGQIPRQPLRTMIGVDNKRLGAYGEENAVCKPYARGSMVAGAPGDDGDEEKGE